MLKKLMSLIAVAAGLAGAAYFVGRKHFGEDMTVAEMIDATKDKIAAPVEKAKDAAAELEASQAERIDKAQEILGAE